jgi:hypothetical protein
MGGIYALERIAHDSASDRAAIADILTAYVRAHAPWPPARPGTYIADAPLDELPDLQVRAPEVQAILTVLGREAFADYVGRPFNFRLDVDGEAPIVVNPEVPPWAFEGELEPHLAERGGRFDLRATDLRCASLPGADLHGANLSEAHLEGANLIGARLAEASLARAHLRRASLVDARMERADLFLADLQGALLAGAHLEHARLLSARLVGADLSGACLRGASFGGAHIEGARLVEADLAGADLSSAKLEGVGLFGATADSMTAWPEGFDLQAAGVRFGDEGQSGQPTRRLVTRGGPGRSRRLLRGPRRV